MEHPKLTVPYRGKRNSGVALLLVLMLVVLTTIMVLAFFLSVQTETKSMRSVISGQSSRQLADIATQSVISQIQQATTQGVKVAWASQPGMIRTYDNTGAAVGWYKLYSSVTNLVSNPTESLATIQQDVPTQGWATAGSANYGVYTDINSPVYSSDGTLSYPIVNPNGATSIATANGTTATAVLGFNIATASTPGYTAGGTAGSNAAPTNNPAAMPVLWIYVLRDGTQVPAAASGTPGIVNVAGASRSNPIVGRIAYWTDDETCKLNVNTAADGTYFDTPRFAGPAANASLQTVTPTSTQDAGIVIDHQLATTPPVAGEYQRNVGGPAQTKLSYVLGSTIVNSGNVNKSNLMTLLSPFMQWGGSEGGIYNTYSSTGASNTLAAPARQTPYASLDEWMFSNQQLVSNNRVPNPGTVATSPPALLTNTNLQQLRFFLSANSEAPEVNLFGQPRISMWPVYSTDSKYNVPPASPSIYLTPFDQMIASAATLTPSTSSTFTYFFGRQNAASPIVDWGGTANTSMSLTGSTSNTRNQNLFVLLHTLASNAIPGYGFSFKAKYSIGEMDQILTEIFDYCRSLDPSDPVSSASGGSYAQTGAGTGTWGVGQVTPICIPQNNFGTLYSTKGFGRFDTISDIALDFTQTGVTDTNNPSDQYITGLIYVGLFSPSMGYPWLDPHLRVVVQSPGAANTSPGVISLNMTTDDGISHPVFATLTGSKVFSCIPEQSLPDGGDNGWNNAHDGALLWGGAVGGRQMVINHYAYQTMASPPVNQSTTPYMLCGLNIEIPKTCKTFSVAATPLEIKVYHANTGPFTASGDGAAGAAGDLVQDITVQFPGFSNLPLPTNSTVGKNSTSNIANRLWWAGYGPENNSNTFIDKGDVIQSLVGGYNGDLRIMAAQSIINDTVNTGTLGSAPSSAFVPHPLYGLANQPSTGLAMAHSFWDLFPTSGARFQMLGFSNPSTLSGGTTGQLVPNAALPVSYTASGGYPCSNIPATGFINPSLKGTANIDPGLTGDWDNGWGHFSDGPYINKADEAGYQYAASSGEYFGNLYYDGGIADSGSGFSSPNRTMASPVMFGSLPTGVPLGKYGGNSYVPYKTVQGSNGQAIPWQTLLFRPQAGHYGGSNGGTTIEDEELLDWFWMPVVQPYAISTTLATEGKVNLNYQIAPFTYITRATALMGVLGSEYVIAVPTSAGTTYKTDGQGSYPTYRTPVKVLENDNYTLGDSTGTFVPFKQRFANGQIFKSAAEICDIYLVPQGQSWTNWAPAGSPSSGTDAEKFWTNNQLTGDNSRERPYNGLYSRLTTKSNTYTVHMRAQALLYPVNATAGQWVENPQFITSEYRGSVTINRYLDPQDPNIPDFTATSNLLKNSIDSYYKYRVLETRRFLP